MSEKGKAAVAVDLKAIGASVLTGVIIYFLTCLFWAFLIHREILQYDLSYILSKVSLLLSSICGCFYIVKKGRGETFLNTLSCSVILFALGILMALAFPDKTWDTAGAVICLLICCMSCLLLTLHKSKNSKLHKRRTSRRK